jgi:hypothetical protein
MAQRKLNKTISTFTNDPTIARVDQIRRDNDKVRTPKITLEDVDYAMISYLTDVIKPTVIENESVIDVPVMFANGETYAQIQKRGFMRDAQGKIMTPVITLTRSSITERDSLKTLGVNQNPDGYEYVFRKQFTNANRYDRFAVQQNKTPRQEYYVSPVPEFIDVSYTMMIWTEYTRQLNSVIEQIMPTNGFAWGTTYKFPVMISDYGLETTNVVGEDRIVRTMINFTTKGTLLMPFELRTSNLQKRYSMKTVKFSEGDASGDIGFIES